MVVMVRGRIDVKVSCFPFLFSLPLAIEVDQPCAQFRSDFSSVSLMDMPPEAAALSSCMTRLSSCRSSPDAFRFPLVVVLSSTIKNTATRHITQLERFSPSILGQQVEGKKKVVEVEVYRSSRRRRQRKRRRS